MASGLSNSNRGRAAAGAGFAAGIRRFQQNLEKAAVAEKLASPSVSLSKSLFRQAESRILDVSPCLLRTRFLLHPQLNRGFSLACPANKEKRGAGECPPTPRSIRRQPTSSSAFPTAATRTQRFRICINSSPVMVSFSYRYFANSSSFARFSDKICRAFSCCALTKAMTSRSTVA